ncbi:MAG: hypothetical protein QHJ73_14230, partial [Armatimonadota bacterium]|nr:hypothetical protein [Armatimonadota bacterium]
DEFFAAIRECYNRRSTDPAFACLTFCLLGVATPTDLIRDTRTTPFNVGRRIELEDFTEAEAAPLLQGLTWRGARAGKGPWGDPKRLAARILHRVLYWTGGHPYLTQRLCSAVARELAHATVPPRPATIVDHLCQTLFLEPGARERDDNLVFVRERLLRSEVDTVSLLELYAQVWRKKHIHDDDTNPLKSVLRLSGVTRAVKGVLRVRNRIYARVFDLAWVRSQMPDVELRRQRAAFVRGLLRAAAVSGVIVAVMAALAATAVTQARRADRNLQRAQASECEAREALAATARERDRANREALRAREAQAREHEQRVRTEKALQLARQERARAIRQQRIAEEQRRAAQRERARAVRQQRIAEEQRLAAERERHRADTAEQATQRVIASYLQQARSDRHSGRAGRRFEGLSVLGRAAAIRPSLALRNEAIACMALADLRPAARWRGYPSGSTALALDDGLQRYARGNLRGEVSVRTVPDDRELFTLPGPGFPARALLFSPDGRYLAARYYRSAPEGFFPIRFRDPRNEVRVWDLQLRKSVLALPGGVSHSAMDFSPDGTRLVIGAPDGGVAVYQLPGGEVVQRLPRDRPLFALRYSPDGRYLAMAGAATNWVKVHPLEGGRSVTLQLPGEARTLAWSADGRMLATGAARPPSFPVLLWNMADPQRPQTLEGHQGEVVALAFGRAGDLLASVGRDQLLRLWRPATGEVLSVGVVSYPLGFFDLS